MDMKLWREYDDAAAWCARRGLKGECGDPLPPNLSVEAKAAIDQDPEAFTGRVNDMGYELKRKNSGDAV